MNSEPIVFIPTTFEAYETVRVSGVCNMMDSSCVIMAMVNEGYVEEALQLVKYDSVDTVMSRGIRADTKKYMELLKQVNELHATTAKMLEP